MTRARENVAVYAVTQSETDRQQEPVNRIEVDVCYHNGQYFMCVSPIEYKKYGECGGIMKSMILYGKYRQLHSSPIKETKRFNRDTMVKLGMAYPYSEMVKAYCQQYELTIIDSSSPEAAIPIIGV